MSSQAYFGLAPFGIGAAAERSFLNFPSTTALVLLAAAGVPSSPAASTVEPAAADSPSISVSYAGLWGGAGAEEVAAAGVDAAGNIYVIGTTNSTGLATPGAFQLTNPQVRRTSVRTVSCPRCEDSDPDSLIVRRELIGKVTEAVFVTKFAPDGRQVIYTTYFKVDHPESLNGPRIGINSMAVSPAGEVAFGLSEVFDPDLPLINATQSFDSSQTNVYVAKLNAQGDGLVFATYLQAGDGAGQGWLRGLAIDDDGSVAVTGVAFLDNNLIEVNPLPGQTCALADPNYWDGFVAAFRPDGQLNFLSCLGGAAENSGASSVEGGRAIDFGPGGLLYLAGYSSRPDFPLVNPVQPQLSYPNSRDVTLSIVNPATSELVFSTYLGPGSDRYASMGYIGGFLLANAYQRFFAYDVKADSQGNIVVVGTTNELDFPAVNAFKGNLSHPKESYNSRYTYTYRPETDFFVTKITPGIGVVFSTYLGGSDSDRNFLTMALDDEDNIYLLGESRSTDYPLASPVQSQLAGESDLVISKLTPDGKLTFSTFFGGDNTTIAFTPGGIAVDGDRIIVATGADSSTFPSTGSGKAGAGGDRDVGLLILSQAGVADSDGDGVMDDSDAFPNDISEYRDTDGDGTGDQADSDDDGDDFPDTEDVFPLDANEHADQDRDGVGDNADLYDDYRVLAFDLDADGLADFSEFEIDIDGDDVTDSQDLDPFDPAVGTDLDSDGVQDIEDPDVDGDDLVNAQDPSPRDIGSPFQSFNDFNPHSLSNLTPLPAGFFQPVATDVAWTIASDQGVGNSWSLGTVPLEDGQSAQVAFQGNFESGFISFQYRVDSQPGLDKLTFYFDDQAVLVADGQIEWREFSTQVSSGPHTLRWVYAKDDSIGVGDDAAWIDQLALPGITFSHRIFFSGFETLE